MTMKSSLLRQFHQALSMLQNPAAAKEAILAGYLVDSSKNLSIDQLTLTLKALREQIANRDGVPLVAAEKDMWRKRVMAAIGGYLSSKNYEQNVWKIKAIACRATGCEDFNKISTEKLRSCYYLFCNKGKIEGQSRKLITNDELRITKRVDCKENTTQNFQIKKNTKFKLLKKM